jgi:chlorophyll/bacteriochlorophyll a synthase
MTHNDYKSINGDIRTGINSLPVLLGPDRAVRFACVVMAAPQAAVIWLLWHWGRPWYAAAVGLSLVVQIALMRVLFRAPRENAAWYSATGVTLYVLGMLVSALAVHSIALGGP